MIYLAAGELFRFERFVVEQRMGYREALICEQPSGQRTATE